MHIKGWALAPAVPLSQFPPISSLGITLELNSSTTKLRGQECVRGKNRCENSQIIRFSPGTKAHFTMKVASIPRKNFANVREMFALQLQSNQNKSLHINNESLSLAVQLCNCATVLRSRFRPSLASDCCWLQGPRTGSSPDRRRRRSSACSWPAPWSDRFPSPAQLAAVAERPRQG